MHSGQMLHWCSRQNYLVLADIWGQRYIRFEENEPITTTVIPDTTTESSERRRRQIETTTEAEAATTTETVTTTEIPTTTAEPLPYSLHYLMVPSSVVYLIRPNLKVEGSYPFILPVYDQYNVTGEPEETNNVIIGYNELIHMAQWNLSTDMTNLTYSDWVRNNIQGRVQIPDYTVPSAAWVDPRGRMVISERELRPFQNQVFRSKFYVLPNYLEPEPSYSDLWQFATDPRGMAWSTNNDTLYYADGAAKTIYKCSYSNSIGDVSDCAELMSLRDIHENAEPRGLATDTSDHLWVAVSNVGDSAAVLEIDPETQTVVSTFDVEGDKNLVDLAFAGEELDIIYLMSEQKLYKISGMGVTGRNVTGFIWQPDF